MIASSSETLNLPLAHVKFPSSSSSSLSSPTTTVKSSSPSSPFRFRLQKPPTELSSSSSSSSSSSLGSDQASDSGSGSLQTILKRKRPAKLDILVAAMSFAGVAMTPREARREELEEDREGSYSVYCKKGRREAMEHRFSAVVDFHGDPK